LQFNCQLTKIPYRDEVFFTNAIIPCMERQKAGAKRDAQQIE
jgi:hypothetical protein